MTFPCDPNFNNGFPMLIINRDLDPRSATFGQDLMSIPIFGPDMDAFGISLLEGYSGFYHTPITQPRENYAYQEGSTPSDFPRVEERILDFTLGVRAKSWDQFKHIETVLWHVMKPPKGKPRDFILRMYHGPGEDDWREITMRLERTPKDLFKRGPGLFKSAVWALTTLACDPYWYSKTLQDTVTFDTGTGTGAARISQRVLAVSNHADQECWLEYASNQWTTNPTWASTLFVPDGLGVYPPGHKDPNGNDVSGQRIRKKIEIPTIARSFVVQTHPLQIPLETEPETQAVANMRGNYFDFALPPHTVDAQLPVTLVGGNAQTQLSVYATQRWDRCWGGEAL
ncbi:hypothetical protein DEU38_103198 [Rhodococcus sp. AG1013]|uniref:hypothetical protein n=1 Tax=Rhodococcus sp. AG1013 TaxID=2183996 RepID=UPI000E0B9495|nr:hypothetical protein [Rhodococcus sp. AG1013]RDI32465.1 hypothetical protein DEU38_103198 [Rhodococcus sp. AG1013]